MGLQFLSAKYIANQKFGQFKARKPQQGEHNEIARSQVGKQNSRYSHQTKSENMNDNELLLVEYFHRALQAKRGNEPTNEDCLSS